MCSGPGVDDVGGGEGEDSDEAGEQKSGEVLSAPIYGQGEVEFITLRLPTPQGDVEFPGFRPPTLERAWSAPTAIVEYPRFPFAPWWERRLARKAWRQEGSGRGERDEM